MANAEKAPSRLLALDGMRGLAALSIALHHNEDLFDHSGRYFTSGWISVDLFFLISGVVLSHVYEERIRQGKTSFTEFLSHRLARLWPLHFFAMLTMLAIYLSRPILFPHLWGYIMDLNAPFYTFLLNLVLMQNVGLYDSVRYSGHTWDGAGWSLTPEIVANLVWFYLVAHKRLSSKLLVAIVLVFAVLQYNLAHSESDLILSSNLLRCSISFGIGCLLYRHLISNSALPSVPSPWNHLIGLGLIALIVCIILDRIYLNTTTFNEWPWIFVLFLFPALTVAALQQGSVLNVILSSRPLVYLGTISYSVYLLHVQVALMMRMASAFYLGHPPPQPLAGIVALALTIGIATLTYYFIEVPARKALRNRLEPYLRKIIFDVY